VTSTARFELIDEFRLTPEMTGQLQTLLRASFPESEFTQSRTYLKQLPQRRLLAWSHTDLVGHMGIEHRVIGLSTGPATILGVIDLCVAASHRNHGLASAMLNHLERLGREHHIEFLLLFAQDSRLYARHGYHRATNLLRWLKIHEHRNLGIGEAVLEELMVKPIGARAWPDGPVDLLGYQF